MSKILFKKSILVLFLFAVAVLFVFEGIHTISYADQSVSQNNFIDSINNCNNIKTSDENLNNLNSDNYVISKGKNNLEEYIEFNVNNNLSKANKFESRNIIWLKQSLIDESEVKYNSNLTLNNVFSTNIEDSIVATFDMYNVLYNLDDNSKYYVGYINTCDGKVLDVEFARNNYHGQSLDDCIYDYNTGLIYVPKSYTQQQGINQLESVFEVQCQMLISVKPDKNHKISTNVEINFNGHSQLSYVAPFDICSSVIEIPVFDVDLNNIDVIADDKINLNSYTSYDKNKNILYINISPASINKILVNQVNLENNNLCKNNRITASNDLPMLPDNYKVNQDVISSGFNYKGARLDQTNQPVLYTEAQSGAPYQDRLLGVQAFKTEESMQQFKSAIWDNAFDIDLSNISVAGSSYLNLFTFWPYSVLDGVDGAGLALKCGHIGTPASYDFSTFEVRVEMLDVNEAAGYAVVGFCTSTAGHTSQGGCGIYKVKYERGGGVQMDKASACSWSENNPNYSYKNGTCVYSIYNDKECTSWTGVNMTLDSKGHGQTDLHALLVGNYYVREDRNNHGSNYEWNSEVGSVYVAPNSLNWVTWPNSKTTKTYDVPIGCHKPISLKKADAQTQEAGVPEGNVKSFEGAWYSFDYYTDYFKSKLEIDIHKQSFQRNWVMSTDKEGIACIDQNHVNYKVSGDDFYYDNNGTVLSPLGTYVIHEVKPIAGYLLSDKYYIIQVISDGQVESSTKSVAYDADSREIVQEIIDPQSGSSYFKAFEQVIKGDYKFIKVNDENIVLSGIPFKITSKTTGEWHIVVTDSNGVIDTSAEHFDHTKNTNINDDLFDVETGKIIQEDKLTAECGCWFGLNKHTGEVSEPNDSLGALPFDSYTIQELEISKNTMYYPFTEKDFEVSKNDYKIDGGTWVNSMPSCSTQAQSELGNKILQPVATVRALDRVYYSGLIDNNSYEIKSWIIQKETEEPVALLDGYENYNYKKNTFFANNNIGYIDIDACFDSRIYAGNSVVWYVEISECATGRLIVEHKDKFDISETLYIDQPYIVTNLYDANNNSKYIDKRSDCVLRDVIDYQNVLVGQKYNIHGVLYDKSTGEKYINEFSNSIVETNYEFVANAPSGKVEIEYKFNSLLCDDNKCLVSFVDLNIDEVTLNSLHDLYDENETCKIPETQIQTNATIFDDEKEFIAQKDIKISDKLLYKGLPVNKEIKYYSWFVYEDTGIPVSDGTISDDACLVTIDDLIRCLGGVTTKENRFLSQDQYLVKFFNLPNIVNENITSVINNEKLNHILFCTGGFNTEKNDGQTTISYKFDASSCREGNIVAYTILQIDNVAICANTNINDKDESLCVKRTKLETTLSDTQDLKELDTESNTKLIDKISYQNIIKGEQYIQKGQIIDKDSKQVVAQSEKKIIPENINYEDVIEFNFDSTNLEGRNLVCYEYLILDNIEAAAHADINNKNQTVHIKENSMLSMPKTSDWVLWFCILFFIVILSTIFFIKHRSKYEFREKRYTAKKKLLKMYIYNN